MKRLHVHVSVKNLLESIRFYSGLFGMAPNVEKNDYAKWMLDDPRVNFAISTGSRAVGVHHLGIQAENAEELAEIERRASMAGITSQPEPGASCCYARSDKHWLEDPQGVVWEAFHSMGEITTYGAGRDTGAHKAACCAPASDDSDANAACSAGAG